MTFLRVCFGATVLEGYGMTGAWHGGQARLLRPTGPSYTCAVPRFCSCWVDGMQQGQRNSQSRPRPMM